MSPFRDRRRRGRPFEVQTSAQRLPSTRIGGAAESECASDGSETAPDRITSEGLFGQDVKRLRIDDRNAEATANQVVGRVGLEPTTNGLRVHCSTN